MGGAAALRVSFGAAPQCQQVLRSNQGTVEEEARGYLPPFFGREGFLDLQREFVDLLLGRSVEFVPEEDATLVVDGRDVRIELAERGKVLPIVLADEHQRHWIKRIPIS